MVKRYFFVLLVVLLAQPSIKLLSQQVYEIQALTTYVTAGYFPSVPGPGDIVKILAPRSKELKIVGISGDAFNPVVFINSGGQVNINTSAWGALEFMDCQFIKVTGTGDPSVRYGFTLLGSECGLSFTGLSSDCEAEFIEIIGGEDTFFGLYAKKDFGGKPPVPYPQFNNLIIHDLYIHGVSEGMYIGETISPGMEFRHVRVYNNIIRDTHRESIQIANCVEDIEINNNLMMNSGLYHLYSQENILQIGGNSIAKVYNNILINGPTYGVIVFGMGEVEVFNNYSENNLGVFIDDRYWSLENSPINFHNNYFLDINGTEAVKNMNQFNELYLTDNQFNTDIPFFLNAAEQPPIMVVENNALESLKRLNFTIKDGVFIPNLNNSTSYSGMGPVYTSEQVPERIFLSKNQVNDMVNRGSRNSPDYLVDEQHLNPEMNKHPRSKSWVPSKNTKKAPFHVVIDLEEEYYLEKIMLHDQKKDGKLFISYYSQDGWIEAISDPCKNNKAWNSHSLGIKTQYIRLSMYNTVNAAINELAIYGYPSSEFGMKTTESNVDTAAISNVKKNFTVRIYPNPASTEIHIEASKDGLQTSIVDLNGRIILQSELTVIDISHLANGIYLVRTMEILTGNTQTNRLIVNH